MLRAHPTRLLLCQRTNRGVGRRNVEARSDSDPFSDVIPFPRTLPNRLQWKKTFTTNEGIKYICRACDVDDIPSVTSLLIRSKLAGFPTEENALRKYIAKSIEAFPRGCYLCLLREEKGTNKKTCVGVVGVSNTPETRKDDFEKALQFTDDLSLIHI